MATQIGSNPGIGEKIGFAGVIAALGLLLVAMTQPVWRGEAMINELKADCSKRHGIVLEHKKMFGTSYECVSRLDT